MLFPWYLRRYYHKERLPKKLRSVASKCRCAMYLGSCSHVTIELKKYKTIDLITLKESLTTMIRATCISPDISKPPEFQNLLTRVIKKC